MDDRIWNPASDALIARTYRRETLRDKAENKLHLQTAMGLEVDASKPLFAVVSRLTSQKGLDLLLAALPTLLAGGAQLALLGAGDNQLQEAFLAAAAEHPGQVGVQIGYHEAFSHRIMAGADVIVCRAASNPAASPNCTASNTVRYRWSVTPGTGRYGQ